MMNILGLSAFYHDSAACLVQDGEIVAAAQEERFTRKKHDSSFPENAVRYCLRAGNISREEIDLVVFYEKPFLKFERILETYLSYAPRGIQSFLKSMPLWIKEKIWTKDLIREKLNGGGKILFARHHESHAASAFFPSPFKEAAILTMDGVGEWATSSIGVGHGNDLRLLKEIRFPHSLGLLYSAFTYYMGFKVNSGEYKVMGLAAYGEPRYKKIILSELIDLKPDGSFKLNMKYFDYCVGLVMTNGRFHRLFGGPPRKPESDLTQREMDLARSIQEVTEEAMVRMARHVQQVTGQRNLCLAGGVALNCVGNGKILKDGAFENIWIQPAAGDAGGALGAALLGWYGYAGNERIAHGQKDSMKGGFLGPDFDDEYVEKFLAEKGICYSKLSPEQIPDRVADFIAQEKVIGWFQGRMEFGPRGLGARSILGDARSPRMQSVLNLKIKHRESFRPFAPSVMLEKVSEYFELNRESSYMLLVAPVRRELRRLMTAQEEGLFGIDKLNTVRSTIPAVTHVDYSARIQTVDEQTHGVYYRTIRRFSEKYGCGVIVNTSFNVRGEPLVCTPEEAYRCFMRTEMDYLVMGNLILDKREQKQLKGDIEWKKGFQLD